MILASKSPRRYKILSDFGVKKIEVVIADIEEISNKEKVSDQIVDIAVKKGLEVAIKNPNSYIVSADTSVILDGTILGKPKNEDDAFEVLTKLSNRSHQVITGYSLINKSKSISISGFDTTIVTFKNLSPEEITWYIKTKEPMDKAGSYGIQGVGSGVLIKKIDGEFYNVMGFPISKFVEDLKKIDIKIMDIIEL